LLSLVAIAQILIVPLITNYWSNRQEIADAITLLERYQASLDEEPMLLQKIAQEQEGLRSGAAYLKGPTAALAGAELQDRVRLALGAVGREMKSTEILHDVSSDTQTAVKRVGLRVRLSTITADLQTVLFDLETGKPYLFLNRLVITKAMNERSNETSGEDNDQIDVTFDVFGLLPK
jgi:general secretion pathway protein M